ncbi:DivIVA domain-containing protein, partial [Dietzia massiliensis]|uniref:DivIVA domain-containing protein n=1 Tax=Dietzia massiliensis TaxID=2697499 RepID=UPI001BD0BEE2
MPLTPADVHNVAFSKPPIGKRGYNEDEVDQFLDLVETELAELVSDNEDLRQRVEELTRDLEKARKAADEAGKSSGGGSGAAAPAAQAQSVM